MILIKEIQFVKINENKYVMINLINAAADIIDYNTYEKLTTNLSELDENIIRIMKDRKYIFDTDEEYNEFILQLNKKICEAEKNSPPCFLVIPTYSCNLQCTYCYERTYKIENFNETDLRKIIDTQFDKINDIVEKYKNNIGMDYDSKKIRVTIMGGEPLLSPNKQIIKYIIEKVENKGYTVDAVTNGVDLNDFIDILKSDCVDHIQVTLDGSKEIHDKRRIFASGKGSFDKIMQNLSLALKNDIVIYLRVNVDQENINDLPKLAKILYEKFPNNTNLRPYIYLLQDGGCSGDANVVKEEVGIEKIFELEHKYPEMAIFRKKFHPATFINAIFNNQKFSPSLKHCGAAINQYIFDCKGNVYRCWHGIGNDSYRIGTYLPKENINIEKNEKWNKRSVLNLRKCIHCKYRYICGTGCPAATHKGEDEFDIEKESCVDYESLINVIIKEKIK